MKLKYFIKLPVVWTDRKDSLGQRVDDGSICKIHKSESPKVWTTESLEDILFFKLVSFHVLGERTVGLELRDYICFLLR